MITLSDTDIRYIKNHLFFNGGFSSHRTVKEVRVITRDIGISYNYYDYN